ncbi:MAG TPA: hypothetical protein PKC90_14360 [Phycisphaerales bacterium]|nr:hypothetical protein [Phycisphaerales bacterium]
MIAAGLVGGMLAVFVTQVLWVFWEHAHRDQRHVGLTPESLLALLFAELVKWHVTNAILGALLGALAVWFWAPRCRRGVDADGPTRCTRCGRELCASRRSGGAGQPVPPGSRPGAAQLALRERTERRRCLRDAALAAALLWISWGALVLLDVVPSARIDDGSQPNWLFDAVITPSLLLGPIAWLGIRLVPTLLFTIAWFPRQRPCIPIGLAFVLMVLTAMWIAGIELGGRLIVPANLLRFYDLGACLIALAYARLARVGRGCAGAPQERGTARASASAATPPTAPPASPPIAPPTAPPISPQTSTHPSAPRSS